jgi:hypothetical protein
MRVASPYGLDCHLLGFQLFFHPHQYPLLVFCACLHGTQLAVEKLEDRASSELRRRVGVVHLVEEGLLFGKCDVVVREVGVVVIWKRTG